MIPREKPKDILWDAEWVAMHTELTFPEVADAGFLADFKKVMIEVAGDRLYDYRAAEQVEALLVDGGHSCPIMEQEAAAEGFTRYSKIKDFIRLQMVALHKAADQWKEQMIQPDDKSVLDGVDPDLIVRAKKLLQAYRADKGFDYESSAARSNTWRDEERARREAQEKAADIASYPKREDWP